MVVAFLIIIEADGFHQIFGKDFSCFFGVTVQNAVIEGCQLFLSGSFFKPAQNSIFINIADLAVRDGLFD